jgi:hypothetical protein
MRVAASVTSISWIPSEAISGLTRLPFDLGITHYDDPPEEVITDVARAIGPDGARFANHLSGWAEVEDGRIVDVGQDGEGRVSTTRVRLGGVGVLVEAFAYPDLHPEPQVGDGFVRFVQTAGGRPGLPAPRLVSEAPFVRIQGPTVWTTLALTLHADGTIDRELLGGSTFPRHWLYDSDGRVTGKSAVIDFKTWYKTATPANSPWGDKETSVPSAAAETALERRLSVMVMRGGRRPPKPRRVPAGTTIITQGDRAEGMVLLLDGVMAIEVDGQVVGEVGPGSLIGERAGLESGRRTATVRAVTDCRAVEVDPSALSEDDLRELAEGHRREEQPESS